MDNYHALQQILDTHPSGAPAAPAFDRILRILFTEEEAALAVEMSFTGKTAEEIAKRSGADVKAASKLLEGMANKGIVYAREKKGVTKYSLLPTIPGLFEFPFMNGMNTPELKELGTLWNEYKHQGQAEAFAGDPTPQMRVIPVNRSVQGVTSVHPYDEVHSFIENADYISVTDCACRVTMQKCDRPTDVCMIFGSAGRFLVERGFAREVTKDEAKHTLDRAEEAGLVHTSNNSKDRANLICNCCPCCCTILRGKAEFGLDTAFMESRYMATVNEEECTGCAVCVDDRCPVGAVTMNEAVAVVNQEQCIGCGLCVSGCPSDAMEMVARPGEITTPETVQEMAATVLQEKGKLDAFMKVMKK